MPYAEARKIIGAQPMGKLGDLTTEFGEALRETAVPGEQRAIIVAIYHGRDGARLGVCLTAAKEWGCLLGAIPNRAEDDLVAAMGILAGNAQKKRAYDDG